jgi:hypothetical protein
MQWHWSDMIKGIDEKKFIKAEVQFLILSVQTQTTLGYTDVKPQRSWVNGWMCLQAIIGLFFTVVFVAMAVNRISQ